MKMGSLFDGSGGFPLAASMNGITPEWASEIEKYPLSVTKERFPDMEHLGDVRDIDGGDITPVDIITFGSPCQDLSVAGKRGGLKGGRSKLFHEAIRIISEMRKNTDGQYPRFAIWENVFGAFSSNGGNDFYEVLKEFCAAAGYTDTIPKPENKTNGLVWERAGSIVGNGFSVAWRTFDAQYWGVPQRRRRIFLVADFAGECAEEILFEQGSESGDSEKGESSRQTASGTSSEGPERVGKCLTPWDTQTARIYDASGVWPTLSANESGGQNRQAVFINCEPEIYPTLKAGNGHIGISDGIPNCVAIHQNASGEVREGNVAYTLGTNSNASGRNTPPGKWDRPGRQCRMQRARVARKHKLHIEHDRQTCGSHEGQWKVHRAQVDARGVRKTARFPGLVGRYQEQEASKRFSAVQNVGERHSVAVRILHHA